VDKYGKNDLLNKWGRDDKMVNSDKMDICDNKWDSADNKSDNKSKYF
jgi:hypothetical protein